ncbi:MAG: fimbrial-type adhesion domain containing protein [Podoviridae sp. ctDWo9]|nr:MAG: fimbrial-type adhesion domain containing protein [Podoviridae sp. ctDWo9]
MATFSKITLSGSTDGKLIKVAATATAGTTIHTASTTTTTYDEVWLYAVNSDTTDRKLTIEFGGTTSPDDLIEQTITAESGLLLVVPGLILKGNASALVVRAFCATANVVSIGGYVNRIAA